MSTLTMHDALNPTVPAPLPGGGQVTVRRVLLRDWAAMTAWYTRACARLAAVRERAVTDDDVAEGLPEVLAAQFALGAAEETAALLGCFCDVTETELARWTPEDLAAVWQACWTLNVPLLRLAPVETPADSADAARHERDLLALLHRAGIDPRDPTLTVAYALALADAHAAHERRSAYHAAYLHAIAVSAAVHGNPDAWHTLEAGLRDDATPPTPDIDALARLFNKPPAEILAALDAGWKPPRVTEHK